MKKRHGKIVGTREMIELLQEGRRHGYDRLRDGVETALAMGSCDVSAVRYLMTAENLNRAQPEMLEVGTLSRYERSLPVLVNYDTLLNTEVVQ